MLHSHILRLAHLALYGSRDSVSFLYETSFNFLALRLKDQWSEVKTEEWSSSKLLSSHSQDFQMTSFLCDSFLVQGYSWLDGGFWPRNEEQWA